MTDDRDRIEFAKWLLERTLGWVAAADGKVAVAVALNTAMLGGLAAAYAASDQGARTPWSLLWLWVSASGLVIATFFASLAAVPRTLGPIKSMIFFVRVAEQPLDEYLLSFHSLTEKDLLVDLATQIHRNSEIASTKHRWIRKSLIASFLSAIAWAAAVGLLVRG